ncbi:MAG: hypothetical protein JXB62_09760 [Pirellulales bacterium]|nr:hypothetical protein [Pirellulales bacterium]
MKHRSPPLWMAAAITLATLGLVPTVAYAVVWDDGDPTDSYWSTPGNWNPDGVPDGQTAVAVSAGTAYVVGPGQQALTLNVTSPGAVDIASSGNLSVDSTVEVGLGATLTVDGSLSANELYSAGTTTFGAGSGGIVGTVRVTDGTTTLAGSTTVASVDVRGGILTTPQDLAVESFTFAGGLFQRSGVDGQRDVSAATLVLGGGNLAMLDGDVLTVTAQATIRGGAVLLVDTPIGGAGPHTIESLVLQNGNLARIGDTPSQRDITVGTLLFRSFDDATNLTLDVGETLTAGSILGGDSEYQGGVLMVNGGAVETAADLTLQHQSVVDQNAGTVDIAGNLFVHTGEPKYFLNGGVLAVSGQIALATERAVGAPRTGLYWDGGTLTPGANDSIGLLNVDVTEILHDPDATVHDFALMDTNGDDASTLLLQLGPDAAGDGFDPGIDHDQLSVTHSLLLDGHGTLALELVNGYVPVQNDTLTIVTADHIRGTFSNTSEISVGEHRFEVTYVEGIAGNPEDNGSIVLTAILLGLTWDGADSTWSFLDSSGGHDDSHWDGGLPEAVPDETVAATVHSGRCTVDNSGTALSLDVGQTGVVQIADSGGLTVTNDVNVAPDARLVVDGTLTAAELSTAGRLAGGGTIEAFVSAAGQVSPDGTLDVDGVLQLNESAEYVCELGGPLLGPADDLIAVNGDVWLRGTLTLAAVSPLGLFGAPGHEVPWGDTTRTILRTTGEGSVNGVFDHEPGVGTHLGYGAFLTDRGANGQGVGYPLDAVTVDLLQAAPGDTDGNRFVNGTDIQDILAANKFGRNVDADWTEGDFDADRRVNGIDIQAILAANLFGRPTPYAATAPGERDDGMVKLVVVPGEGVYIDTGETTINSYVITSAAGLFTGDPAENLGLFQEDTDSRLSGSFAYLLSGRHFLGSVLGLNRQSLAGSGDGLLGDLAMTYTIQNAPGTYQARLIVVPEPHVVMMLLVGAIGLLPSVRRQRRRRLRLREPA